jgi:hypothetical protein
MSENKDEWCIVRWRNPQGLMVFREYQWEAQGKHYQHKWEYVARGFKSNEDALQWVCLFKE